MNDVIATLTFTAWFLTLSASEQKQVLAVVEKLTITGLTLPYPHSSNLGDGFRELRVNHGDSPLRVIYAYDPHRDAVLILGGNKAGNSKRLMRELTAEAEKVWAKYLAAQKKEDEKKKEEEQAAKRKK